MTIGSHPPKGFAGWIRAPGFTWQRVVEGATRVTCWDALLDYPVHGKSVERLVLPAGQHPDRRNGRQRPPQRARS